VNHRPADLPHLDLQPGELYLAQGPVLLRTILGSCVGVTFRSERLGAGALCHGVLPRCPPGWPPVSNPAEGHRYVDFSIRFLARQFAELGVPARELEVKVFGGGDVLPVPEPRNGKLTVGAQNCRAALEVLEEEGLRVMASDLGGSRGRRIQFHTGTGEVRLYRLADWKKQRCGNILKL